MTKFFDAQFFSIPLKDMYETGNTPAFGLSSFTLTALADNQEIVVVDDPDYPYQRPDGASFEQWMALGDYEFHPYREYSETPSPPVDYREYSAETHGALVGFPPQPAIIKEPSHFTGSGTLLMTALDIHTLYNAGTLVPPAWEVTELEVSMTVQFVDVGNGTWTSRASVTIGTDLDIAPLYLDYCTIVWKGPLPRANTTLPPDDANAIYTLKIGPLIE